MDGRRELFERNHVAQSARCDGRHDDQYFAADEYFPECDGAPSEISKELPDNQRNKAQDDGKEQPHDEFL